MDSADDLRLALDVSDRAAGLALRHFEAGVTTTTKDDGTPVTEADRAVERLIRQELESARAGDALFGEELGVHGDSARVWIIDPIDGTSFFSRHDPHWRVHLALQVAGRLEVAVVTAPALGRRWWATRGGGAFESAWPPAAVAPDRLSVSTTATVSTARVDALDVASRDRLRPGLGPAPGSPLPLVELVRGEIDAFLVEGFHLWDHAPWILLVEEAGGRFTDRTGGADGDRGGGLYSNAALHPQLLAALGYPTSPVR
ncbi:inositol monophosphatase family protein [Nocardioides lianchengensis]|uniref:Histidinol-phosphatase n=1 Tax=Nocardioides lianchengensis TaxID=1045774 RepID=A0A1G6R895_9ACTN|nr:inositol monophosphatase [Nocardioides lianchengensis]NYG10326.1 histidinol-phosphatase [Nocardioides lianchengensis]SDD00839.1 histidinol-phosphatase [Nocardioides lianchengensis]